MEPIEKTQLIDELKKMLSQIRSEFGTSNAETEDPLDFEFYEELKFDGLDGLLGNTDAEQKLSKDFVFFGERGCGSMAAVWLLEGRSINYAPVVLFGSEGELEVIASDFLTFTALCGLGYDMFQFLRVKDLASAWHSENPYLINWLKTTFKAEAPQNLPVWLEKVKSMNPNIQQTMELTE